MSIFLHEINQPGWIWLESGMYNKVVEVFRIFIVLVSVQCVQDRQRHDSMLAVAIYFKFIMVIIKALFDILSKSLFL